ncbi:hypothetical protein EDD85DRAFT_1027672 [Armillaria nabsnona]|nr:hypothetical protein EDD85DRAFT_1027672 [Armillaria nabsnona]
MEETGSATLRGRAGLVFWHGSVQYLARNKPRRGTAYGVTRISTICTSLLLLSLVFNATGRPNNVYIIKSALKAYLPTA